LTVNLRKEGLMKQNTLTNKNLLYYYMKEAGYTVASLAEKVGMSRYTLMLKASGKREFTSTEISNISKALNITDVVPVFLRDLG